jgi:hypothetical protein
MTVKDLPIDDWRFNNFTSAQLLAPAISGDTAKPDGVANLVEYGLTIAPGGQAPAALPRPQVRTYSVGDRLALVFTRDTARSDVSISVEAADTPLGQWTEIAASANGAPFTGSGLVAETPLTGTLKQVEVRDIVNRSAAASRVMRVSVTR